MSACDIGDDARLCGSMRPTRDGKRISPRRHFDASAPITEPPAKMNRYLYFACSKCSSDWISDTILAKRPRSVMLCRWMACAGVFKMRRPGRLKSRAGRYWWRCYGRCQCIMPAAFQQHGMAPRRADSLSLLSEAEKADTSPNRAGHLHC